jgi:serine/threonine protein kinase
MLILLLCKIALKEWQGDEGGEGLGGLVEMLANHFSDQGKRLGKALRTANERTWKTIELALSSDSWWDRMKGTFTSAETKAMAQQVRTFLLAHPLTELVSQPRVRELCLRDLNAARAAGHLEGDLDHAALVKKLRASQHFGDDTQRVRVDVESVNEVAAFLEQQNYKHLAWLLKVQVSQGRSLLVASVRYYFRREVEKDRELFQGLAYQQMENLAEAQSRGFEELQDLLNRQSAWFDESLRLTRETIVAAVAARTAAEAGKRSADAAKLAAEAGKREAAAGRQEVEKLRSEAHRAAEAQRTAVLDLKAEMQRTVAAMGQQYESQFQKVYQPLIRMLEQLQLQNRPLRASDSLSIRNDRERKQAEKLVHTYRSLPVDQRRGRPALVNALGQLEFAVNDFDGAQRTFSEAAAMAPDTSSRAEAYYNAFRASLERVPHRFDEAMRWLKQAIQLDEQFAPFPLGAYEPLRILGAGGFGVTFLCRHRLSGGEVAIKSLSAEGLDRDVDTLFQEANALERLNHPTIVRLRDCGFADRACTRPFLIMDYFPGQTLEAYVTERGPLSFEELVPLATQAAEALQAAHRANLLHRDVKPANLLVRREGRKWQAKLIDFGLALRQDVLTRTGSSALLRGHSVMGAAIVGTLDYAAPEQMGKLPGVPVGPAADIYGFAKMCSYALFKTPEPTYLDWQKLPRGAAELFAKCLARLPDQRPASFLMMLRQLEQLQLPEVLPVVKPAPPRKGPPPLPPTKKAPQAKAVAQAKEVPTVVPVVRPAKAKPAPPAPPSPQPTTAQVRFFMAPQTGLASLVGQPLFKVYLNKKHLGEGWARSGFQLCFELPPGRHSIEVVYWQNAERGRKEFVLDLPRPGAYEVRFNAVVPDLSQSLFGGTSGDLMQKCTIDVLKTP